MCEVNAVYKVIYSTRIVYHYQWSSQCNCAIALS